MGESRGDGTDSRDEAGVGHGGSPGRSGPGRAPSSLLEAFAPLILLLICLVGGAYYVGLSGSLLVVSLLVAAAAAGVIAARQGVGWTELQRNTGEKLLAVLPAILILLSIGMLIGTWMLSGTIPYMVHWGVRLIEPEFLLLTAFLATCTMSLFTGTSWGSVGTIGVALMGVAAALDAPLAATAGAVVSGAYFGDKLSPLSDTTNVAALAAGTPLYVHIRHMLWTSVPSTLVAALVYLVVAQPLGVPGDVLPAGARLLLADLGRVFILTPLALLPVAVIVAGVVAGMAPALAITASSVVAMVLGFLLQPFAFDSAIYSAVRGFTISLIPPTLGTAGFTDDFRLLVERGGLYSMARTLVVIIAAFLLAGAMSASGALDMIVSRMLSSVRSTFGLIASTMATGLTMIALTSHAGVTALVTGSLYQDAYRERKLAPENLSRSIEDSVTITEPLMPWTVSGVFMAATLGVPTLLYAPWAVFCFSGPLFSLLIAATYRHTGRGITQTAS
jgi:Na+:H+ antiporter, NhaC family